VDSNTVLPADHAIRGASETAAEAAIRIAQSTSRRGVLAHSRALASPIPAVATAMRVAGIRVVQSALEERTGCTTTRRPSW
jgi:hypothetical protein